MTTKAMVKIPTFWIFLTLFGGLSAMGGKILSDTQDDIAGNAGKIEDTQKQLNQMLQDAAVIDEKLSAIQSDINEIKEDLKEMRR